MTVRLAQLKASAELDASKYVAGARQVEDAGKRMTSSQTSTQTAMTKTQQRAYESARAFDKFRASVDPAYRAQVQLEQGAIRAKLALEKGQITAAEYSRTMGLLQSRATAAASAQGAVAGSVGGLIAQYKALAIAAGTAVVALGVREYIQASDAMTNYASRIRLVAGSAENAATVQEKLLQLANRTRVDLDGVVTLYARLGRSADALGVSQDRLLGFVETFSQALKISGASTAEANSTVLQLSQALASGYLRGAELNAVLEAGGRAAQALADGLGVPIGQLKKLGEAGDLEAGRVIDAIESQSQTIQVEFDQMKLTVGDAMTVVNNKFLGFLGKVDQAVGASTDLAESIRALSETLNNPDTIAAGVAIVNGLATAMDFVAKAATGAYQAVRDFGQYAGNIIAPSIAAVMTLFSDNPSARVERRPFRGGVSLGGLGDSVAPGGVSLQSPEQSVDATAKLVDDLSDSLSIAKVEAEEFWLAVAGGTQGRSSGGGGGGGGGRRGAASSVRDARAELEKFIRGLEQEADLSKLSTVERRKQEVLLQAQKTIGRDLIAGERERVLAAIDLTEANRAALEAQADQAADVEDAKRQAQEFSESITSGLADAFFTIFDQGKDGFRSLIDDWRRRFFSFLADMAAKALVEPIVLPVLQQAGLGGVLGGAGSGGLGANFGSSGVGGVASLGAALGDFGKTIDQFGRDIGLQKGGATGPFADGTGLFGTNTALSDVAGGALSGLGTGATVAGLTGGNALGGSVGGLVGGALGSFLGPIGSLVGSAIGGFLGGMFGPKPTNASAIANFDEFGGVSYQSFAGKTTAETANAVRSAADQISGGIRVLEAAGLELTDRVRQVVVGARDPSYYSLSDGVRRNIGTVGDPNDLALEVVKALAYSARTGNADLRQVLSGNEFSSLEDLTNAVDFVKNVYGSIVEARRPLTQVEQAMKSLTEGFKTARKEAEKLGLSLEKFDVGARNTFNQDIADQILAITDPVAASLAEFERSALARVDVAKQLGADLVQVERLNALERARVLAQAEQASVATLRSLIDDLQFGGLSAGVAPEQQYFSALSSYNDARRAALDLRTPEAIAGFDQSARALLPIAQSFLGVSERYADVRAGILDTARTLGTPAADPSSAAIVAATVQGSNAIVEQVKANTEETRRIGDELRRNNAFLQGLLSRKAS